MDLHRQFDVLPHWDRSCRSNFLPHTVTPGRPVPALTLQRQAPGRVATGVPILKSLALTRPGKIPWQAGFEPQIFRSRGGCLNHEATEVVNSISFSGPLILVYWNPSILLLCLPTRHCCQNAGWFYAASRNLIAWVVLLQRFKSRDTSTSVCIVLSRCLSTRTLSPRLYSSTVPLRWHSCALK